MVKRSSIAEVSDSYLWSARFATSSLIWLCSAMVTWSAPLPRRDCQASLMLSPARWIQENSAGSMKRT
ncbi:hypothetical protein WY02_15555 [Pseudonocardia sp. AL041005-10]|nr:hypothetical protein WY02_15555 [Pseudonocardia sp. AL041005-10]